MFKPILAHTINPMILRNAISSGMQEVNKDVKSDFEKTQSTWEAEDKAEFVVTVNTTPLDVIGAVFTLRNYQVYGWVNNGTKRHPIPKTPKADGFLVFQTGYKAKTKVGWIASYKGGKLGPTVAAKQVDHPGNEGRFFDKAIVKRWTPKFKSRMKDALSSAIKNGVR